MSFQEAYDMFGYYDCVLFIGILLQEQFKDFVSTVLCFLMSYSNQIIIPSLQAYFYTIDPSTPVYDFYLSAIIYEMFFFSVGVLLINSKIGWVLMLVSFISAVVNMVGIFLTDSEFYTWYQKSYGVMNIIMFEVLVWACIVNSRLRPYLEKLNQQSTEFLNKQLEKWREHNKKRI